MLTLLKSLWKDESGQATVEYALVLGLVAVGVVGSILLFRTQLLNLWTTLIGSMTNANAEAAKKP
jgi:Flp pilus assembly pilin Flp